MCGARRSRVPNEVSSSTRPSGAPRQKWIPAPNVMCGFGSRPRSSSSGRSNAAGGRVVGPEPLELIGVAVQGPPAVAGHVHRGLVAGVQQEDAGADHLVLGEAITLVDHLDQATDQVLGRVLAALTDQLAEVIGELHGRRRSRSAVLLGGIQLVHPADLGRPRTEVVAIGLGDAQQLGDHRHRERLGHRGDQIDLAGAEDLLNQPVHQPLDGRPELLDPAGGERLGHQPADAGVVWRLHVEDAVPDQVPERRREQRILRATHLPVRGQMEIGASKPPVAQQPVDVLVVRDDPLLGLGVVDDPAGSAKLGVRGIRVGDEHEIARTEPERRGIRDRWDQPDGPKVDPPPILAGGASDPAVARVALHADGYVHGGGPPRSFARVVERVRVAWRDAGRPGEPMLWGQGYLALGDDARERGLAYMRDYYAFTGPFAEKIAAGLLTTPQDVAAFLRGYADLGCQEMVLLPAVAELEQIGRLQDVLGSLP